MTLALNNLGFERNDQWLFNHIHCVLQAGDILQLRGANGSGKSTLLRMLAGFIEPQEGMILWRDVNIFHERERYQQSLHYIGHHNGVKQNLTVYENLQLSCALANRKIPAQTIRSAIQHVDLGRAEESLARYLSAGQLRRLSLARLLLNSFALWLLDEPTTALDAKGHTLLINMIDQHVAQGGIVVVATHHDLLVRANIKTIELGVRHV